MGGWLALTRWQLYLVVGSAFVLGVLGIRARLLAEGEARLRAKLDAERLRVSNEAAEIRNEVEALDRDTLKRRAAQWVRGGK